ncbi:MAG: hypothetical protein D6725_07535, partial [Planctomycetota bacterium]
MQERIDRSSHGAGLGADAAGSAAADGLACLWFGQPSVDGDVELLRVGDDTSCIVGKQQLDHVRKVPRVRAEADGRSECRRFENVLAAAAWSETAADEGHRGQPPAGSQFADRVEDDHRVVLGGG